MQPELSFIPDPRRSAPVVGPRHEAFGRFAALILLFCTAGYSGAAVVGIDKVDFNRDIRPILSENCYKCHGPDGNERKAKLRFDIRDEALKPAKSGERAIVPGSPAQSKLVERITAADPDDLMPPTKSGKKLTVRPKPILTRSSAGLRWI